MSALLDYRAAVGKNRGIFVLNYPAVVRSLDIALSSFDRLARQLGTEKDGQGNSHVSLLPFLFILQRQTMAAFDALASHQAYLAWVALRPGIESALIMGKWFDDPNNAQIWERRFENPHPYIKQYQGKALISISLPRSADVQQVLKEINDHYLHPNPRYYRRHLELTQSDDGSTLLEVNFFDDDMEVEATIVALMHLVVVTQDAVARMFAARFPRATVVDVGLRSIEANWREEARRVAALGPLAAWTVEKLGLWPPDASR